MEPQQAWQAAYHQLELQLDRASFDTWLRQAMLVGYADGTFVIGVPTSTARDMLEMRLYRNIRRILSDVCGFAVELRFEICKPIPPKREEPADMPLFRLLAQQESAETPPALHHLVRPPQRANLPESELNPKFVFDRFIVNQSNRVVYEAACAVADYPATVYNPFFVYGGVGLGKTHLLQAIGHACQNRGLRVIYVSSEVFFTDLILAIRERTTAMFREKYRTVDVLLVDDIQFIGGKDTAQEEFFHTFNALVNYNKQVVLASDRHPRDLSTLDDRLRSRFQGGLVADIQPPEYETRVAILQRWAEERQIRLSAPVIEMLASRGPSNVRELEGMFNRVAAQARVNHGTVSVAIAADQMAHYQAPRYHRVTLTRIIETVAEFYNVRPEDIIGPRRSGRINSARQVAMWLARELTDASLSQIGDYFGGRSHTTVIHGCNKMQEEMDFDPNLAEQVASLRLQLVGGGA